MAISKITGESIEDGSIVLADLGIKTFNTGSGNTLTLQANSATGIVIDVTGNTAIANTLSFTATGARITGDFSNTTFANRVAFQTSTANGSTTLTLIPNGTGQVSQLQAYASSDPTNSSRVSLAINAQTSSINLNADRTGSGAFWPFTIQTGGAERLRIDTSGNVGIGTTNPTGFVNQGTAIVGTASGTQFFAGSTTDGVSVGAYTGATYIQTNTGMVLGTSGAYDNIFRTNGTERMRILSTGNIGINTTSPSQLLHVAAGTILASNTSTNSATVAIAGNGSAVGTSAFELIQGGSSEAYVYNRANSYLVLGTNNAEKMRILSGGAIGISNSSPGTTNLLTVGSINAVSRANIVAIQGSNPGYDNYGNCIEFGHSNSAGYRSTLGAFVGNGSPFLGLQCEAGTTGNTFRTRGIAGSLIYTDNAGAMLFGRVTTASADNQTATESMRIDASGNLGIGTSSPAQKLDVYGRTAKFNDGIYTGYLGKGDLISGGAANDFALRSDNALGFATGGAYARMQITAAGDVGIGTTNPGQRLDIQTSGSYCAVSVSNGSSYSYFGFANVNGNYNTNALANDACVRGTNGVSIAGNNGGSGIRIDNAGGLTMSVAGTKIYNSSGRPMLNQTGGILQVVSYTSPTTSVSTSSTSFVASGISVSITPSSTSSKIWVIVTGGKLTYSGAPCNGFANIYRSIGGGAYSSIVEILYDNLQNGNAYGQNISQNYLDSPATTSAVTYQIYFRTSSNTYYIVDNSRITITVMEIAG